MNLNLLDGETLVYILIAAIWLEVMRMARGRYMDGKPEGPDYSCWGYQFLYDPERDWSSKLLIFFLHVLKSYLFLIGFGYIYILIKNS